MTRVKMNAKHEYEFVANYKILQNVFRAHKLDKVRRIASRCVRTRRVSGSHALCQPIPVERLVKCKMQYVP